MEYSEISTTMIEIRTLGNAGIEQIHTAWIKAFADYPEPYNKSVKELQYLVDRRGYRGDLSFGAFENDEIVSYTLNGIGKWNGLDTAYDTGTGTVKEYRRQGLAVRIFEESLPVLRANNIRQYLLEVIRVNEKAFDLYRKQGFEITRELDYYVAPIKDVAINKTLARQGLEIKELNKSNLDWALLKAFWDFEPAWQNSIDAISRKADYFTFLGIFDGMDLVGYGVVEAHTGDIPQLAISKGHRGNGLGSMLLGALKQNIKADTIRIINADAGYEPFTKFMGSMNIKPGYGQYEMILQL